MISTTGNLHGIYNGIKVSLPGLHITLGIFYRLFTLLEDECHKLDIEMASLTSPQSEDRQSYVDYSKVVKRERALLDEKETIDKEMKWLYQAITHLTLNSITPSTDPQVIIVAKKLKEIKDRHSDIVSLKNNYTTPVPL